MTYSADREIEAVPSASAGLMLTLRKAEEACIDIVTPAVGLLPETKAPLGPDIKKDETPDTLYQQFWLKFGLKEKCRVWILSIFDKKYFICHSSNYQKGSNCCRW